MGDYFIFVELRAPTCEVELLINSIPITRRGPRHGAEYNAPVHQYLVDGVNELDLVIDPGQRPSRALRGDALPRRWGTAEAHVELRLIRYRRGQVVGSPAGVVLARQTWGGRGRQRPFPCVVSTRVELHEGYGRWAWQDAEPLIAGPQLRAEVTALLSPAAAALGRGDFEVWVDALGRQHEEAERAYDLAPRSKRAQVLRAIAMDHHEKRWTVPALVPGELELRLCARRRLVACLGRDGLPILRTSPDARGLVSTFPALVGRVDGALCILR